MGDLKADMTWKKGESRTPGYADSVTIQIKFRSKFNWYLRPHSQCAHLPRTGQVVWPLPALPTAEAGVD